MKFTTIACTVGYRDHATVIHGCNEVEDKLRNGDYTTIDALKKVEQFFAKN